jgi:DNA modification methylase
MKFLNEEEIKSIIKKKNLTKFSDEIIEQLGSDFKRNIDSLLKTYKNKERIAENDAQKENLPFLDVYPDYDLTKIPSWVRKDIENANIIGNSKKVVQVPDGRKYHLDNPLNDLSGQEWTYFTCSVINTRYPTQGKEGYAHKIRKVHPSPKPPQLTKDIISFFTKENEWVLDYFMGVGGSLLGASLCNRKAIGIDLNPLYIEKYIEASNELNLPLQQTIQGDSVDILSNNINFITERLNGEKVSLILIDPPYGDMMSRKKTGEAIKRKQDDSATPFTNSPKDLGNMASDDFFISLKDSVKNSLKLLKDKGHVVLFIKDLQPKEKKLNLLHADLISLLNEIPELYYLGTRIWADHSVNLFPYGYPFSYVSNQIHQYIIVFKLKRT